MGLATLYKYVTGAYTAITDEQYTTVGASTFQLGTVKRAFIETSFVIRTAAGGGGTLLTLNTDYSFQEKDANYTTLEAKNVWTGIKILTVAFQTGDLFISYRTIGSYTDPTQLTSIDSRVTALEAAPVYPIGYLYRLILSNAADTEHDITISEGGCRDSSNGYNLILASAITKRIDAGWAAGTGSGGLFSGSVDNTTWYYVFLIRKDSDGTIDAGFDTSITAANKPAGYTYYRRIGAVKTDGSANILKFRQQNGNEFIWDLQPISQATNPGANAVLQAVACPPSFIAMVFFSWYSAPGALNYVLVSSPLDTDTTPSGSAFDSQCYDASLTTFPEVRKRVKTDSSSRFRYRIDASGAGDTVYFKCEGWVDEF